MRQSFKAVVLAMRRGPHYVTHIIRKGCSRNAAGTDLNHGLFGAHAMSSRVGVDTFTPRPLRR